MLMLEKTLYIFVCSIVPVVELTFVKSTWNLLHSSAQFICFLLSSLVVVSIASFTSLSQKVAFGLLTHNLMLFLHALHTRKARKIVGLEVKW